MTSYITITDAETDPEAPLTSELAKKWRDNPIAIAEGDATAPKIYGQAMFGPSAGAFVQRNCLPWGTNTTGPTNATVVDRITASAMTALVDCTIRVRVTFTVTLIGGSTASVAILKNGSAVQTYTTSQTLATTDVPLLQGDSLAVRVTANGAGTTNTATVSLSLCQYLVNATSAVMT